MNYIPPFRTCDIANGEGVRVSLFVAGCRHHCENCFSPQTWDFCSGEAFTDDIGDAILNAIDHDHVDGLTLLGGEPLDPENAKELVKFIRRFRERFGDTKTLWVYTGCLIEDVYTNGNPYCTLAAIELLAMTDVVVDGPYVDSLRDPSLAFRGSSNQRIIRVNGRDFHRRTSLGLCHRSSLQETQGRQ